MLLLVVNNVLFLIQTLQNLAVTLDFNFYITNNLQYFYSIELHPNALQIIPSALQAMSRKLDKG